MGDVGDLCLVIGDWSVPTLKKDIPECFKDLLSTDKLRSVFCTGNLGSNEILERVQYMATQSYIVKGSDDDKFELPESHVIEVADFRVGILGGHQILPWGDELAFQEWQRKLDVDVLISGHEHYPRTLTKNGKLYLCPGSVTGVINHLLPLTEEVLPSFMLLQAVEPTRLVVYVYRAQNGEFNVQQYEHQKG